MDMLLLLLLHRKNRDQFCVIAEQLIGSGFTMVTMLSMVSQVIMVSLVIMVTIVTNVTIVNMVTIACGETEAPLTIRNWLG